MDSKKEQPRRSLKRQGLLTDTVLPFSNPVDISQKIVERYKTHENAGKGEYPEEWFNWIEVDYRCHIEKTQARRLLLL